MSGSLAPGATLLTAGIDWASHMRISLTGRTVVAVSDGAGGTSHARVAHARCARQTMATMVCSGLGCLHVWDYERAWGIS